MAESIKRSSIYIQGKDFMPGIVSFSSLSACKFSLHYPHKISCLVVRIKQLIIHSNLSKMKNKILPTCLQGNYRDSLGEFSNI